MLLLCTLFLLLVAFSFHLVPARNRCQDFESRIRSWKLFSGKDTTDTDSPRSASIGASKRSTKKSRLHLHRPGRMTSPTTRRQMVFPRMLRPKLDPVSSFSDSSSSLSSQELDNRFSAIKQNSGILSINGKIYKDVKPTDLREICELGQGTCGRVTKCEYRHQSVAVKEMKRTDNLEEAKRLFTDLEVITKCNDCEHIVRCCGYILTADFLYIVMEVMATCLDKLLRHLSQRGRPGIPEPVLAKITLSVLKALNYLKENHKIMHRDIKPSNILLDYYGNVKLCDFGICGKLIDSKATSRSAGCVSYLAPERIQTDSMTDCSTIGYDVRADVWSLGITLLQLATGTYPYETARQISQGQLELMLKIKQDPPPTLPSDRQFSPEFREFIAYCLTKEMNLRPKFKDLLDTPFLINAARSDVDVGLWYQAEYEGSEEQN